ncbi:DUF3566 domain-containing protein [bacterium]|nr:DUF3566 domain-containing protein [bacterium]
MTWVLKRIPLGPVAKVGFILYFAVVLVMFLIYSIFLGGLMDMVSSMVGDEFGLPVMTGGALILGGLFLAIFLSVIYTLITLLAAVLYNAIAGFAGGIEFDLQERYPTRVPVQPETVEATPVDVPPAIKDPGQEIMDDISRFMPGDEDEKKP